MTTLVEAMLETARLVGVVYEGVATGGSTTSLTDTRRTEQAEFFSGGALFITSGALSGKVLPITSSGANTITFPAQTKAVAAGDTYVAITKSIGGIDALKQAVLYGLRHYGEIMLSDDTSLTLGSGKEYIIPDNIKDIRRVEVKDSGGSFVPNYYWKEIDGKLIFDSEPEAGIARIWYAGIHPTIKETESLNNNTKIEHIKWLAAEYMWRLLIQTTHKDNNIAIDMLNEAKAEALLAKQAKPRLMPRDPHLGGKL